LKEDFLRVGRSKNGLHLSIPMTPYPTWGRKRNDK
jgi:hypothetical protein